MTDSAPKKPNVLILADPKDDISEFTKGLDRRSIEYIVFEPRPGMNFLEELEKRLVGADFFFGFISPHSDPQYEQAGTLLAHDPNRTVCPMFLKGAKFDEDRPSAFGGRLGLDCRSGIPWAAVERALGINKQRTPTPWA